MKKLFYFLSTLLLICGVAHAEINCPYVAIPVGTTDVSVFIRIIDDTAFTPEEGVTDATAGLDLYYQEGAHKAHTAITEADLSAITDAHSDGGLLHTEAGKYRVDLPDDCCNEDDEFVTVGGEVTGMIVLGTTCPLDITDDLIDAAVLADNAIDDATFAADTDSYWVDGLGVIITATETKIGFHWKDNGVIAPLDAGDTTIACTDTADATVFSSADDGEYGTSNVFHETYAGVFADGEPVSCTFTATIDAVSRVDAFVITKTGGDVDITRIGGSQNTVF